MTLNESGYSLQWPFLWPVFTTESMATLTNSTTSECVEEKLLAGYLEICVFCSAGVILLLLNLVLPRWREGTIQGWLDLVVPIKFVDSTPFRVIYCLGMSAWAGDILKNISDSTQFIRSKDQPVLDALNFFVVSPSLIILKQCLAYFPVLACVDGPLPVLAHSLGCLHTTLLASHNIYSEYVTLRGCSSKGHMTIRDMIFSVVISAPVYVIYIMVAGWFFFQALLELPLVLCTKHKCYHSVTSYYNSNQYYAHVKGLLKRNKPPRRNLTIHNLWNYLQRGLNYVLPYHEGFSYPLPFLSALCMGVLIVYQLGLSVAYASVNYTERLMVYVREFNVTVETVEYFFPQLKPRVDNLFYDAKSFVLGFNILIPLSVHISVALTLIFTLYMAQHYHKLLVRGSQGDLSFLVSSEPLPSVPYRLAATMKYTAFQFSYIVFSWMIYFLMMASLMTFGLLSYFLFKNFQELGVHIWSWVLVPLLWGAVMHEMQLFLCNIVFLKDKAASNTGFVPIRFKSLYQFLSYLFFFFNVIYGFVMCFLRVFGVLIFTVIMLLRMDWDVYMRGLEGWDTGNRTFVGYMYMEVTNNHPVVRAFIALLQDSLTQSSKDQHTRQDTKRTPSTTPESGSDGSSDGNVTSEGVKYRHRHTSNGEVVSGVRWKRKHTYTAKDLATQSSRRVRNRWLVAYILLYNPSLRTLTASSLRGSSTNCFVECVNKS